MTKVISLYNVSYQKLLEIDWKHAVVLLLKGKVVPCTEEEFLDIIEVYDETGELIATYDSAEYAKLKASK